MGRPSPSQRFTTTPSGRKPMTSPLAPKPETAREARCGAPVTLRTERMATDQDDARRTPAVVGPTAAFARFVLCGGGTGVASSAAVRRSDALGGGERADHRRLHPPLHRAPLTLHFRGRATRRMAPALAVCGGGHGRLCGDLRGDGRSAHAAAVAGDLFRAARLPQRRRARRNRPFPGAAPVCLRRSHL
jgi:hypothetical protein